MTSLFPTQQRGRGAGLCGLERSRTRPTTPILMVLLCWWQLEFALCRPWSRLRGGWPHARCGADGNVLGAIAVLCCAAVKASALAKYGYLWPGQASFFIRAPFVPFVGFRGALISLLILPSLLLLACAKRAAARGDLAVFQRAWLF